MSIAFDDIETLFIQRGNEQYSGEPVSQLEHALQCASLAEQDGADAALVTAALLHDFGHLLHDLGETPTLRGIDDLHQFRALPLLRGLFGSEVLDPIALHVDAKRYLCANHAGYYASLSDDSKRSLALQGGIFSPEQSDAFMKKDGAAEAIRVRIWDDRAKLADCPTKDLSHFLTYARRCLRA
jgi:phosphonate degradation associated HDIG domain protein